MTDKDMLTMQTPRGTPACRQGYLDRVSSGASQKEEPAMVTIRIHEPTSYRAVVLPLFLAAAFCWVCQGEFVSIDENPEQGSRGEGQFSPADTSAAGLSGTPCEVSKRTALR